MVGVINTAYDTVMELTLGFVRWWQSLFVVPEGQEYLPMTGYEDAHTEGVNTDTTFVSVKEVMARVQEAKPSEHLVSTVVHQKHTVMYTQALETSIYANPTIAFDSRLARIPYGSLVLVMEPQGRFYRIVWNEYEGWVLKDDLADRASAVYPAFVHGQENLVDGPNTAHVRTLISDEFGLAHSEFPLQAGEYVAYKLLRRGVRIPWPVVRPRMPGSWHQILRGAPGVHIGVMPKQGAVMEYVSEQEVGHLAYVEAVFPDGTITISESNHPHGGIYSERALTKDGWKSLRPVFIEVS